MNKLNLKFKTSAAELPRLVPVSSQNMGQFCQLLSHVKRSDPFSTSAAYFAMTGRKGLWVYGDDKTFMVIARHPNRDGHILFFPPTGVHPLGLIECALDDPQIPQGKIELARIGPDDQHLISRLRANGSSSTHTESVLDWTYPVHIVSSARILHGAEQGSGKAFASFRGHLNSARKSEYKAAPIDIFQHEPHLISIIEQWAESKESEKYCFNDLTSPTRAVIDLMKHSKSIDIGGSISWDKEGAPIGFWLWQQSENSAMSLVRAYIREQRGNSEFGILSMSQQLHDAGIPEMCLGGSETENLDTFKNKMRPVRSIELTTMSLPEPILSPPATENNHRAENQRRLTNG